MVNRYFSFMNSFGTWVINIPLAYGLGGYFFTQNRPSPLPN
nr:MAG TPA: hypothetical protein [Caudoviricetes sp.]